MEQIFIIDRRIKEARRQARLKGANKNAAKMTSKQLAKKITDIATKKFDPRHVSKFVDLAVRIVKQDSIKTSLDFLSSGDYDNMKQIFEIVDFISVIELYSEKCGTKEMQKLHDDFNKDLAKGSTKTKANLWRYVAEDKEESEGEEVKDKKGAKAAPKKSEMTDSTVSQN